MSKEKKDNIITAILLCFICLISSCLILLSNTEKPANETAYDIWSNRIIDISSIKNKKVNNTTAIIKLDVTPGIKNYNITVENNGTLNSYIDSYDISSDIINNDIKYNLNIIKNTLLKPKDTITLKLTIENNTTLIYEDAKIMISINMVNRVTSNIKEFSVNNLKYNNHSILKNNNLFSYKKDSTNNYIKFAGKCYQIIEIIDNDIIASYSREYKGTCINKKILMKVSYDDLYKIFDEVSSSGEILKEYEFSNKDLLHLSDFYINNIRSKITLLNTPFSNTIDWTLIENGDYAKANDNNFYSKNTKLNITPVIRIKNINNLSGTGTVNNPYIIRSYIEE